MRKFSKWFLTCTAIALISGCSNTALSESKAGTVTKKELAERLDNQYGANTLEQLTLEKILLDKYPVKPAVLDSQIKFFMTQQGLKTEKDLDEYLKNKSVTRENFENSLKVQLAYEQALLSTVKDAKNLEEAEYNKLKEQIRASHILLETKEEADSLLQQIKADPSKFEELAKTKSKDTASASENGDLGFFAKGYMDAAFEEAAFALQKGQISEVVQSQFGYHIIKVTDRATKTKTELLPTIWQNVLGTSQLDEAALIDSLKKSYNVTIKDEKYKLEAE